jgi:hypothetical protein
MAFLEKPFTAARRLDVVRDALDAHAAGAALAPAR